MGPITPRALEAALLLSEKNWAQSYCSSCYGRYPSFAYSSRKLLRELLDAYKKEGQLILSKCSDVVTRKGLSINTKLLQGNPSSAILDFCEKEKYDILVMGGRGMGKFKELVLGSVSSKVLHHSSCPVMIIRLYGINQFRFYSEFD
jgi:nucleotide-binding universal stress UspA family protein